MSSILPRFGHGQEKRTIGRAYRDCSGLAVIHNFCAYHTVLCSVLHRGQTRTCKLSHGFRRKRTANTTCFCLSNRCGRLLSEHSVGGWASRHACCNVLRVSTTAHEEYCTIIIGVIHPPRSTDRCKVVNALLQMTQKPSR